MDISKRNGLMPIIAEAIEEMEVELGQPIPLDKINLAELGRRTGISRAKLRRLKKTGFVPKQLPPVTINNRKVLQGFTETLDSMLKLGVTNSVVCLQHLQHDGYSGSLSSVKRYIANHKHLVPAKRVLVAPQGNRSRRFTTKPGEAFQMDWGFAKVLGPDGSEYQVSCFAMICHHCGKAYIEFFPNAKQEKLFIGMLHAFEYLGIPQYVLTDNMKSVVLRRDFEGHPIWQHDYEVFMRTVGFDTRLCKPRHPFTKGKVERLVRYVKDNFLCGRVFPDIDNLNLAAWDWCERINNIYHRSTNMIPSDTHSTHCSHRLQPLNISVELRNYLCPQRRISFDGYITFDGIRFGVPYSYCKQTARVMRKNGTLYIYSDDLSVLLTTHSLTWNRSDHTCSAQFDDEEPEEFPTAAIKTLIHQVPKAVPEISFDKFNFDEEDDTDD